MFVIPCKYIKTYPAIQILIDDIRKFHPTEKICVVDSNSSDKSYFDDIKKYDNVIIEDVGNIYYQIGANWHAYKTYPDEDFYYFLHDSMRIKANLDYLKKEDLTVFMYFHRFGGFEAFSTKIDNETKFKYKFGGNGVQGPIYFCKNKVMKTLLEMGADKILPTTKQETGACEGCYGFFFEDIGYDLIKCSMYGDVFDNLKNSYADGPNYSNSARASARFFPIEKYILSRLCVERNV